MGEKVCKPKAMSDPATAGRSLPGLNRLPPSTLVMAPSQICSLLQFGDDFPSNSVVIALASPNGSNCGQTPPDNHL